MDETDAADSEDFLEQAWEEVDRAWDDPEAHRRFLAMASTLGRLDVAGARYRVARDGSAERRAVAEAQLQKVMGLALATLGALRTPDAPQTAQRWVRTLGVALALVLMALSAWALLRLQ